MSKTHIKKWQRALKADGTYTGKIDGLFGLGTLRASFEASNLKEAIEDPSQPGQAELVMINQNATRNQPITENMKVKLVDAATAVYGPDTKVAVYSGGQDRRGHGSRRTGSIRHDNYGQGGRAADCYVYVANRKISKLELAKLGQYWLAKGYGCCGLEMATGGIHLDEWTTPPSGGGMFWTYKYSNRKSWGAQVRRMLADGARGKLP